MAIVAIAGPLSNLAIAAVLSIVFRLSGGDADQSFFLSVARDAPFNFQAMLYSIIGINLLLFCFNLIPIPPLDGFNIAVGILPNYWTIILEPIRRYSVPILLSMVFLLPYLAQSIGARIFPESGFSLNPISEAINPIYTLLQRLFLGAG